MTTATAAPINYHLENEIHVWLTNCSREDHVTVVIQQYGDALNPEHPAAVVIADDPDRPAQRFTWASRTGRYYQEPAGTQDLFHAAAYGQSTMRTWHADGGELTDA